MKITKQLIEKVVTELVGEDALSIIWYLRGKTRISEFIIAEELDLEIHRTRNLLYRLLENNIVSFHRKKDKIKGWYICYWDFNEGVITYLAEKIRQQTLNHLRERLDKEEGGQFYLCKNACARMDFDKAVTMNFKCPECGQIMNTQDNTRTQEFLRERIKELEAQKIEVKTPTQPPATPKPSPKKKRTRSKKKTTKTVQKKTRATKKKSAPKRKTISSKPSRK